jgi:hypothetical protein
LSAQLPQPTADAFSPHPNPGIADAAILGKGALPPDWTDTDLFAMALEQEAVPGPNAQNATNLARYCDLSFACNLGLFLHCQISYPYFITFSLLFVPVSHVVPYQCSTVARAKVPL